MHPLVAATVVGDKNQPISITLRAYLDTLLPADDISPSASTIGVHKHLLKKAQDDALYRRLLLLGTRWLEQQAQARDPVSFAALGEERREQIIMLAEDAPATALERVFFEHTRVDAFESYYSDPAIWATLGYPNAPQPLGFVGYGSAPRSTQS